LVDLSSFDLFVFIVVPLGCLAGVCVALYAQWRAEKEVEKHVHRLAEIRSEMYK
jgi:hypothetical protein